MTAWQQWQARANISRQAVREWLIFDAPLVGRVTGWGLWLLGTLLWRFGNRQRGLRLLCKVHQGALHDPVSRRVEALLAVSRPWQEPHSPVHTLLADYARHVAPTPATARYFEQPERMLGAGAMVLKSPGRNERGVLMLYYLYLYPIFDKYFDLEAIARRYFLVLEPSWSGYCEPRILSFLRLPGPVFVGSIEPRDTRFLLSLGPNVVPVPISNNTWVDHRVFRPLAGVVKDIDVIMLAGWGSYKRHWAFFRALRALRRSGRSPRVALVGYNLDYTSEQIRRQAERYGVEDLLEVHENLPPIEVNRLLNRSKVHILWARREGVNRAIVEAMFAGVPNVVRRGFNYGHPYAHVNAQTGRFATEQELPETLWDMIQHHDCFAPLEWVRENMTSQRSAAILTQAIRTHARANGETWTRDLAVKTNTLNGMSYWDPDDVDRFAADYEFLRSARRR